ncbi:hypothetical protein BLA29_003661 [Euroglyphus maynei]|uniref:Uncharacterized protein n=1 Tax=Euroglyphus maynei TaxID=6958 RepID=A0A1Y3BB69_EURMA|nr:hypothetical protein BLA29_003661 [Euroglyphus maynei]
MCVKLKPYSIQLLPLRMNAVLLMVLMLTILTCDPSSNHQANAVFYRRWYSPYYFGYPWWIRYGGYGWGGGGYGGGYPYWGFRLDLKALAYVLNADNFRRTNSCSNVLWIAMTCKKGFITS